MKPGWLQGYESRRAVSYPLFSDSAISLNTNCASFLSCVAKTGRARFDWHFSVCLHVSPYLLRSHGSTLIPFTLSRDTRRPAGSLRGAYAGPKNLPAGSSRPFGAEKQQFSLVLMAKRSFTRAKRESRRGDRAWNTPLTLCPPPTTHPPPHHEQ